MRGEERRQRPILMVLNVEQRIAKEHPLRRIKQLSDIVLARLSPAFDQMYSALGRPSIPPERLLKASLLMALFSRNRARLLAHAVAGEFFRGVVEQARALRLLSSEHFTVDGS